MALRTRASITAAHLGAYVDGRRAGYRELAEANSNNPIMAREVQQLLQQSDQTFAKVHALKVEL